jgi:hypothetical protein
MKRRLKSMMKFLKNFMLDMAKIKKLTEDSILLNMKKQKRN